MSEFKPYLCISASAGSGKTFQLSHRVLRLLAMDAPPDEIGAYTFSRKAAGEIFDSIVEALRKAASSEDQASLTSKVMGMPHPCEDFLSDLRRVLRSLHRLRIGTLDSRISQMLLAVSVELGLPPEFALMDTQSSEYIRVQRQVLNSIFRAGHLSEDQADTFLQLFEEATHGKSEKSFLKLIERFLGDHRAAFLSFPEPEAWRGLRLENPPSTLTDEGATETAERLIEMLPGQVGNARALSSLLLFIESASRFRVSSTWSYDLPGDTLSKALLRGEGPTLTYSGKEIDLSGRIWENLQALVEHVRAVAVYQAQSRTQALYGFLLAYEATYRRSVLPGGQLSFEDACMLMANFDLLEPVEIAYRLDGEISHWLLDEFQDTNRLQWRVLRPFMEEVLQDSERRRSFFYVGDVKQAIYAWRGGDSELFGQVLEEWPSIEHQSMATSYRSAQPVLDLVNRLLVDVPILDTLPEAAMQRWNREFEIHRSAKTDLRGMAEVVQVVDKEVTVHEVVLEMVRNLPPQAETAVLVRSNREGGEIARVLREAGYRVSLEGSATLRDDTAVEAVLAALKQAAHPADDFSKNVCRLAGLNVESQSVLRKVQLKGLHAAVCKMIEKLPLSAEADFSKARLARLVEVALEFDRLGEPSIDRFLAYVDKVNLKEHMARGVIRIMTIHQCKGLGFDAVIVPIGAFSSFATSSTDALVTSPVDADTPCVTLLPPKDVCEQIPEFKEMLDRQLSVQAYETLCILYVALTRAKQSLQVVLAPSPANGGSRNQVHNWVSSRLKEQAQKISGGAIKGTERLILLGDPAWGASLMPQPVPTAEPAPFLLTSGQKTLPRLEPSREDAGLKKLDREFRFFSKDGRALGSRVHDLLEKVEWVDGMDVELFLREQGEAEDSEASEHVRQVAGLSCLRKPDEVLDLWREQKFETVLNEGWVTGIFDRVVLFRDRAWIQDYKTNQRVDEDTVQNYAPQMNLYRRVLADMQGWEPDQVTCQLIFTRTGEVFEV
ncbi:MAG: UvrD-helicase domain-containing protein [Kiritimatiellia bacterium]